MRVKNHAVKCVVFCRLVIKLTVWASAADFTNFDTHVAESAFDDAL